MSSDGLDLPREVGRHSLLPDLFMGAKGRGKGLMLNGYFVVQSGVLHFVLITRKEVIGFKRKLTFISFGAKRQD